MRINKFIAECGVASRRNADVLIKEGRVKKNGKPVTECGVNVDERNDTVTVDGIKLELPSAFTYVMLNKPKGCVCTSSDEHGRKTIFDFFDGPDKRLFSVGRLDYDSEGLILLTNDGDLSFRLTHPSNEIPKTYSVRIEGEIDESDLAKLRAGVYIDGVKTNRSKIKVTEVKDNMTKLSVTIYEGKNRQIRKMFEAVGKNVVFLKRVAIGDMRLGGLGRGAWRYLKADEIYYLKNL